MFETDRKALDEIAIATQSTASTTSDFESDGAAAREARTPRRRGGGGRGRGHGAFLE